jgi:hypothetical protein
MILAIDSSTEFSFKPSDQDTTGNTALCCAEENSNVQLYLLGYEAE